MAEKRATREAFGETLIELVEQGVPVVAVEADLSKSTTTSRFAVAHPDRFFNVGVAEQDMIGTASGLALTGHVAFTGSFSVFATGRAYDQVRNTVCYGDLDVKLCPTHSGVTVGADGGSHQMLEDIALMRVLPGMRVIVPADYFSARAAIRAAAAIRGPVFVRLGRAAVPVVHGEGFEFVLGKAYVLREGADLTIAACGVMVERGLAAADMLAEQGVFAEVIDIATVKPLDADTLVASAEKTGAVVACEEHSVIGGLGAAVAETLSERRPCPVVRVGVGDVFGVSGEPEELMRHFGLTAQHIADAARRSMSLRRP